MRNSTRAVASLVGIYAGLLGLEHGYFETLQGNVRPDSIVISAIGSPCQAASAWHACEPAMTLIPNFFVTGILAIIVSLIVVLWAAAFVQRKNGGVVLILLSIVQLLVGGGFVPLFVGIFAGIAGTRIESRLTWWQEHLSADSRRLIAGIWPWSFLAFLVWGPAAWILGSFFNDAMLKLGVLSMLFTIGDLVLVVITGFARDTQTQTDSHPALSMRRRSSSKRLPLTSERPS